MAKSVYSLVLDDDVVHEIDKLAVASGTSRSSLINTILAQRVEINTPEMRMKQVFSAMQSLMDSRFQLIEQPSDSIMSVKSLMRYKYRPTIRYSVELARDMRGKVGSLNVRFRTTSDKLAEIIGSFFNLWQSLEKAHLSQLFTGGFPSELSRGRFTRDFYSPKQESLTDEDIGMAIGRYIRVMDSCIQQYFQSLDDLPLARELTEKTYLKYLQEGVLIL